MVVYIDDSMFDTDEIRLMLRGDNILHDSDKRIIGAITRYYLEGEPRNENKQYGNEIREELLKYLNELKESNTPDLEIALFNTIKERLECKTTEKVLAYILLGCKPPKDDLPIKMVHIFGRVQRLKHRNDWLNNFTINAYLDMLTLVAYHEFDSPDLWTIKDETAAPINESIELDWSKCRKFMVGSFREFIIKKNLVPSCNVKEILKRLNRKSDNLSHMSDKDLCDVCASIFTCGTVGSHGCDCFFIPGMTLSIKDIYLINKRYPSITIFGVINNQTYRSGNGGEHWVYLGFHNGKANLICSEGSDFSVFKDGGKLKNEILNYFGIDHSMRKIQHDGFNCAFYSVLSAYSMLLHNSNITEAVNYIGDNAEMPVPGKSIKDIRERLINFEQ